MQQECICSVFHTKRLRRDGIITIVTVSPLASSTVAQCSGLQVEADEPNRRIQDCLYRYK